MKKVKIISILTILILVFAFGCKDSGNTSSPGSGSTAVTVSGTWQVGPDGSSYTIGDNTTPITVPEGVYIQNNYVGEINVTLDSSGNGTVTGEFSGTGTIEFTIPTSTGGVITVTLTGNGTLPPAVAVTGIISATPGASSYTVNGQTTAINTGSAIVSSDKTFALNVSLDASGNGTATGTFNGVGTITFTIPSGINNGTITVTLNGQGGVIPVTYTVSSEGSSYTVNGVTNTIVTDGSKIVNPITQVINADIDANGNGTATGTFSGTGTVTFTVPIGSGTLTVTLNGNGDVAAGGSGGDDGIGDPVVDNIKLQGFENVVYKIKATGAVLEPGANYYIETSTYGVITISGKVKKYQDGDSIVVRVKDQESNVSVNSDGTFSQDVVVYNGENYVTLIQRRGEESLSRSDTIKVKSAVGNPKYQFQLAWDGYGDVDLHAVVGSTEIYYGRLSYDSNGIKAELDVDNRYQYGPENIRVFNAPSGTQVKVYARYYARKPWKNGTWYSEHTNNGPVNYTVKVFNSYGELIQTLTGTFQASAATETYPLEPKVLLGTFVVN